MPKTSSTDFFRQGASLSQQLADNDAIYTQLAGSDPELAQTIGVLLVLIKLKYLPDNKSTQLLLALLDVRRKAIFSNSEKTNEITKMGLQMPRSESVYYDE
jgi:hypothetical protein